MSEYAIRQIRPIQDLMESTPENAPNYAQALVLATIDYIVAAQERYYKLTHSQRRAMALHGITGKLA